MLNGKRVLSIVAIVALCAAAMVSFAGSPCETQAAGQEFSAGELAALELQQGQDLA